MKTIDDIYTCMGIPCDYCETAYSIFCHFLCDESVRIKMYNLSLDMLFTGLY